MKMTTDDNDDYDDTTTIPWTVPCNNRHHADSVEMVRPRLNNVSLVHFLLVVEMQCLASASCFDFCRAASKRSVFAFNLEFLMCCTCFGHRRPKAQRPTNR